MSIAVNEILVAESTSTSKVAKTLLIKRKGRSKRIPGLSEPIRDLYIYRTKVTSPDVHELPGPEPSLVHPSHPAEPGAVRKSEGAIASMFPGLLELTEGDVDRAIEESKKRR